MKGTQKWYFPARNRITPLSHFLYFIPWQIYSMLFHVGRYIWLKRMRIVFQKLWFVNRASATKAKVVIWLCLYSEEQATPNPAHKTTSNTKCFIHFYKHRKYTKTAKETHNIKIWIWMWNIFISFIYLFIGYIRAPQYPAK